MPGDHAGPLVRALWLVQRYGTAEAVDPVNDQRIKGVLFKALGKEGELTVSEVEGSWSLRRSGRSPGRMVGSHPGGNRQAAAAAVPGKSRSAVSQGSESTPTRSPRRST